MSSQRWLLTIAVVLLLFEPIVTLSAANASVTKTIYCFDKNGRGLIRSGVNPVCPNGYVKSTLTPPSAPRAVIATPSDASISVTWTKSLNYGGSSWVGYVARADGGVGVQSGYCMVQAGTRCTINGLSPGVTYQVYVQAYNGLSVGGMSAKSTPLSITTIGSLPATTISQLQTQVSALKSWYSAFSSTLTSLSSLLNSYNRTIDVFGIGNAWSQSFISGFNSLANQIAASPAPYSPQIVQAQNALASAMHTWICYGETFSGFSCPGVYGGWLGNGPQWSNIVSQDISNLTAALHNSGLY
jgi:hypothetical protein